MEKSEGMKKEVKSMKLVKEEELQRLFGRGEVGKEEGERQR